MTVPREAVDPIFQRRPDWVGGSVSWVDARYLFTEAVAARTPLLVEIGTASGASTAYLAQAQAAACAAGLIGDDYRVISYDISARFYADTSRAVGDAITEMLDPDVAERVELRQAGATDLPRHHEPDELRFVFLDANHQHPWPTLDLLALCDVAAPGAVIVMHDINLPVIHPDCQDWGAKHAFDDLDVEKSVTPDRDPPSIGKIVVPDDKDALREQLVAIAHKHPWQTTPDASVVEKLLGSA